MGDGLGGPGGWAGAARGLGGSRWLLVVGQRSACSEWTGRGTGFVAAARRVDARCRGHRQPGYLPDPLANRPWGWVRPLVGVARSGEHPDRYGCGVGLAGVQPQAVWQSP